MQAGKEEEKRFVELYIASFLGAFAAKNYVRNCQNGWPEGAKEQPVDDAILLAREAWEQLKVVIP